MSIFAQGRVEDPAFKQKWAFTKAAIQRAGNAANRQALVCLKGVLCKLK